LVKGKAVSAFDQFSEVISPYWAYLEQQVLAIIGPNQTGTTLAVIPLVTEGQVPLVSLGSSSKIVEPIAERKWIFKTPPNDWLVIQVLMQDLKRRQITDVGFLSVNNALSDTGRATFAEAAKQQGINVVVEDRYGAEDTDMSSQVGKVKAAGTQALINWSMSSPAAVVTKNAVDQGLAIPPRRCSTPATTWAFCSG
jgi:branched-chain amino acid transport system substrate-binding protein